MNTILRLDPYKIWEALDSFDNTWSDFSQRTTVTGRYDETDDGYEYELELPGYKKGDVAVSVADGIITINAAKGKKTRKAALEAAEDADLSKITGQLADGLLVLKVEKQAKAKPVTVKIN